MSGEKYRELLKRIDRNAVNPEDLFLYLEFISDILNDPSNGFEPKRIGEEMYIFKIHERPDKIGYLSCDGTKMLNGPILGRNEANATITIVFTSEGIRRFLTGDSFDKSIIDTHLFIKFIDSTIEEKKDILEKFSSIVDWARRSLSKKRS